MKCKNATLHYFITARTYLFIKSIASYLWTYYHSIMIFQSYFSEFIHIKITILLNMSRTNVIGASHKIT